MSTPKTVAFHTLGCKLNFSETSSIERLFERKGYFSIPFENGADIYVINTCSVTDFADRKCRNIVRSALKQAPHAKIVVIGCYAQLKPEEISSIPGVDLVLGAAEKFNILDYIDRLEKTSGPASIRRSGINEVNIFKDSFSFGDRTRTFLKVQDGCNYKCSFCTIPLARGKSRSDTIDNAVSNARKIADLGTKEIVLTGVNLGDFGNGTEVIEGIKPKKEALFIDLIKALDEVEGISRFRISSIEPNLLTNEIINFVTSSKKFVPHFHIPLQSGSDEILRKMKRRYDSNFYKNLIHSINHVMPHACIGVDVIVGFPGESDLHFEQTYQFLHELDISYLHVFTYSERQDTDAATMAGVVPMQVRKQRNERLRMLSDKKKHYFYSRFLNTESQALLEHSHEEGILSGFTPNYIRIKIPGGQEQVNTIQTVYLDHIDEHGDVSAAFVKEKTIQPI
ncbi:tRNA (N(6)-L-threonylcarbamoyladenosine(37)-C(2))-methylthiotransferase MtaB [soil metagenome]